MADRLGPATRSARIGTLDAIARTELERVKAASIAEQAKGTAKSFSSTRPPTSAQAQGSAGAGYYNASGRPVDAHDTPQL